VSRVVEATIYSFVPTVVVWGDRSDGGGAAGSQWVAGGDRDRGVGVQLDMVGCWKTNE
jgi:hypothetical protein